VTNRSMLPVLGDIVSIQPCSRGNRRQHTTDALCSGCRCEVNYSQQIAMAEPVTGFLGFSFGAAGVRLPRVWPIRDFRTHAVR
jgi:hypothetical protein